MAEVFGEELDGFTEGVPGFLRGGVEAGGGAALGLLRSVVGVALADGFDAGDAIAGGDAVAVGCLIDLVDDLSGALADLLRFEVAPAGVGGESYRLGRREVLDARLRVLPAGLA